MKIFAAVLLLFILGMLVASYLVVRSACTVNKKHHPTPVSNPSRPLLAEKILEGQKWFFEQSYTTLTTTSHDGLTLSGYYLSAGSKNTLILMHGYRATAIYEFAPLVRFYYEQGYNLLLPDQRAHGQSEGKYLSFGIKERYDVLSWIELLNQADAPDNIFLLGMSMGGASVCMASLLKLPENVRGIVADCPFGDPGDQFAYSMSRLTRVPPRPIMYFCSIWTRLLAGWHFDEVRKEDFGDAHLPLLLLHGTDDPTVPHSLSTAMFENYGGKKSLELFEGCGHIYANIQQPKRYKALVSEFLEKYKVTE